mgnify:CR=1 FL=1
MLIGLVNYGMGNINSIVKKLKIVGAKYKIINSPKCLENIDKLILPGVGHFGKAIENLHKMNLIDPLKNAVLEKKKPVLGICLGMQLMALKSEEGKARGLGWVDATVRKFSIQDKLNFKIPQMGWNTISINKKSVLMKNIPEESEFYFIHSFYIKCNNKEDILNTTLYESEFVSAIQKDNIFGVQYHPEKSHEIGEKLFKNFIQI